MFFHPLVKERPHCETYFYRLALSKALFTWTELFAREKSAFRMIIGLFLIRSDYHAIDTWGQSPVLFLKKYTFNNN